MVINQKNSSHILPVHEHADRSKSMEEFKVIKATLWTFITPSVLDQIDWSKDDNDATGDGATASAAGDAWQ